MNMNDSGRTPAIFTGAEWTARRIVLATLTIIGVALAFLLLYRFYMVIFLLFTAIALQVAFNPVVEWLYRHRVPRAIGVIVVYIILLVFIWVGIWYTVPILIEQVQTVLNDIPHYYQTAREFVLQSQVQLIRRIGRLFPAEPDLNLLMALTETEAEGDANATGMDALFFGLRSVIALFAVFVLAFYWTLEGNTILRKVILKTPSSRREELRSLIAEFQGKIGDYFRGTLILSLIVGVSSTLAFFLLGIPQAILLGVIMGVFEVIPIVGPVLGAIPAILLTLVTAPEKTLWVIGAIALIQAIEGNILVPKVMDESVGVNAVVSLLAIAAFGALFGIVGAILAIPLAAMLQIILNRILFSTPPVRNDIANQPQKQEEISRTRTGVLRLEAQEIIQDIHKRAQNDHDDFRPDQWTEQAEDKIETMAAELDTLLAEWETNAQPASTPPASAESQA
jgi:predicted PurR-regulated permease PerM